MAKREKVKPTDGLGPYEIKRIKAAVMMVWHRSKAKKLVIERCTDDDGYPFCEECGLKAPKIQVDHIKPRGDVMDGNWLMRTFCPSLQLQGLCKECHKAKTKIDNAKTRAKKDTPKKKSVSDDGCFPWD
jgi:5-methylcytosine-specific restriction endonuclease McrA